MRTPAFPRVPSLQDEINVLVADSSGRLEEVSAQGDALTEVKLKLRLKGWFTSNSSLVRALLPTAPMSIAPHQVAALVHAWTSPTWD